MARLSRDERRSAVLRAAALRVRAVQVDWAASLTFSDLAVDTGIDQAQIARDFGSKDGLVDELVQVLIDPQQLPDYVGHTEEWLLSKGSSASSVSDLVAA